MVKRKLKREKRVVFPTGEQFLLLNKVRNKLNSSWPLFAKQIKVHPRCLNDWKREKYLLPYSALKKICQLANIEEPSNITIREPFWSTSKAGKIAGRLVYEKYGIIGGDQEYRKKKWNEWWEKEGKYRTNTINTPKPITSPVFSKKLAEFVGILLGDGGITQRQINITLHCDDDKEYGKFVYSLMKNLFKVPVGIYHRQSYSIRIFTISRVELIKFCTDKLDLKIGNKVKQQVDIPKWIKQNKQYSIACMRGLMDTDGCIYNECHRINNKKYCYPKLCFTNHSNPLIHSTFNILKELNFSPKIRNDRKVQLENKHEIIRYFRLVKSNNPKHIQRLKLFMEESDSGLFHWS